MNAANTKKQLEVRVHDIFDKLILSAMSDKQRNRHATNLANHLINLSELSSEENMLKHISCYEGSPIYKMVMKKIEAIRDYGFEKALEIL